MDVLHVHKPHIGFDNVLERALRLFENHLKALQDVFGLEPDGGAVPETGILPGLGDDAGFEIACDLAGQEDEVPRNNCLWPPREGTTRRLGDAPHVNDLLPGCSGICDSNQL